MTQPTVEFEAPPTVQLQDGVMIAWRRECYRSSASARTFQVPLVLIPGTRSNSKFVKALGYFKCAFRTVQELVKRRPKTIICLNLPPFLPLICYLYTCVRGGDVVLDFHSGAATNPTWKPFLPLYRHLVRRSPFTLSHNRFDGALIRELGGTPVHLIALPQTSFKGITKTSQEGRPLFLFVCSFGPDEPVAMALDAMRTSPDFDFVISGNYKKHGLKPSDAPSNVRLAGFMEYSDYLTVMSRSTAVITLSDRPNIMQMAVHEALTIGVPVITNDSPTLREVLGDAGHFIDIDSDSLAVAFTDVVTHSAEMRAEVGVAKRRAWATTDRELRSIRNERTSSLFVSDVAASDAAPSQA